MSIFGSERPMQERPNKDDLVVSPMTNRVLPPRVQPVPGTDVTHVPPPPAERGAG